MKKGEAGRESGERGQIRRRKENALGFGFCGGVGLFQINSHGALRCTLGTFGPFSPFWHLYILLYALFSIGDRLDYIKNHFLPILLGNKCRRSNKNEPIWCNINKEAIYKVEYRGIYEDNPLLELIFSLFRPLDWMVSDVFQCLTVPLTLKVCGVECIWLDTGFGSKIASRNT